MNLIYFELKKTWQARKTYLYLALGIALTIVLFIFNTYTSYNEDQQIKAQSGSNVAIMNQNEFTEEINQFLKETNQRILEQEEEFRDASDKGNSLEGILTLPTYPFYRRSLNEELIKRQLAPQSMRYGTKNSIFLAILLSYLASFLGICFLLLLFGESVSKEFEENSIGFYFSLPIKRSQLFFTKYLLVWGQSMMVLCGLAIVGYMIASIFSGKSSFSYPVIVFSEISMTFIPIIQYVGQVILLFAFVIAFCFALHFLMSVWLKKTSFSFVVTLFLLFEGHALSTLNSTFTQKVAHWNPFTYLNVSKVFLGYDFYPFELFSIENQEYYANWSLPRTMHNGQINSANGIIALSVGTVILLFLGLANFKNSSNS